MVDGSGSVNNVPVNIKVYSSYDTNTDSKVEYNEYKNKSIFQKYNEQINNLIANKKQGIEIDDAAIMKKLGKFDLASKFSELLKDFSVETGSKSFNYADQTAYAEGDSERNNAQLGLDNTADLGAQSYAQKANNDLAQLYQNALDSAYNDLVNSGKGVNIAKLDTNQDTIVSYDEAKDEFEKNMDKKVKGDSQKEQVYNSYVQAFQTDYETTDKNVDKHINSEIEDAAKEANKAAKEATEGSLEQYFASLDKSVDGIVSYSEAETDLKAGEEKISSNDIKPTNAKSTDDVNLAEIRDLTSFSESDAYKAAISDFSFQSGSVGSQEELNKLNQNVTNAINNKISVATKQVQAEYQQALNRTYTAYAGANGDVENTKSALEALKDQKAEVVANSSKRTETATSNTQNAQNVQGQNGVNGRGSTWSSILTLALLSGINGIGNYGLFGGNYGKVSTKDGFFIGNTYANNNANWLMAMMSGLLG